ncbi:MAG: O-antigen ligase family protein [Clostridiales bacterium]|nr:O-antigen ligase family protein [Clostridiales bacterium]
MREREIDKYAIVKFLLCIAMLLILTNGGGGAAESTYLYNVEFKYALTFIGFLEILALLFVMFINKEIKIDIIVILLFLKLILFTVQLIYNPNSLDSLKTYLAVIEALIFYIIFISVPKEYMNRFAINFVEILLIVISLQTMYITLKLNFSGIEFWRIKDYISIPIGRSNNIASYIVMIIAFVICNEENKIKRNLLIIISLIGILFTTSKSAIVVYAIVLITEFFSFKNLKSDRKKIFVGILIAIVFYSIVKILMDIFPDFFEQYKLMYDRLLSGTESGTEMAFNGRFDIYKVAIEEIKNNFFLGVGLNYPSIVIGTLAHNIILDAFLRAGVFNVILMMAYFGVIAFNLWKFRKVNNIIRGTGKMLFFVLLQSLWEPNIGGFMYDFTLWMLIGLGVRNIYETKINQDVIIMDNREKGVANEN